MNRKFFVAISLVLLITLAFSGCTSQEDTQKGLELTEFSYASEIDGKDDYVSHSSTYGPNDRVYMYIEVDGFEISDNTVDVTENLTVYGPEGDVWLDDTLVDQTFDSEEITEIWFSNYVTPPSEGFDPGEYEAEMTFTDNHADEDLTITKTFTIEE